MTGVAALALAIAAPALAQSDALTEQAMALQLQGKSEDAYRLLAPQIGARAGDPNFDYVLGLAAADSGRFAEAIAALQRVLAVQPANTQARAEIARVYAMAGDIDTARAEFNTVNNDPTVPDPVRQRIGRLVRDYDKQIGGGGSDLTGFVDGELGYDSNVNTATGLSSITLPIFAFLGPATLTGPATRMHDGYYQMQAGLSGSTGVSRQTRVYASALGSWRDNSKSDLFDQAGITGTAGGSHTLANQDVVSLSGQVQRFWLDRTGYRTSLGTIGQYTKRLSQGSALSGQIQYFRSNYDNDPLRDANRYGATITYANRATFIGVGGGVEQTVRAGARNLGYWFVAGQAGGELAVGKDLVLLAGASVEHRGYDGTEPLFLKSRDDTQVDASLSLRIKLTDAIALRPRVTYTRNFSNIALYDYARVTGSAGLRFEF
ncbi:MAG: DUF560 domain-containing protein [Sphingomonadales bacterium]|nr:MAG: DUF560 domain-containing protein [Sphingomonadales bacterium]